MTLESPATSSNARPRPSSAHTTGYLIDDVYIPSNDDDELGCLDTRGEDQWEMDEQMMIPFGLLELKKTLGKGHYGEVKLASWKRGGGQLPLNIAAKVFNVKQVRFVIHYLKVLQIVILTKIHLICIVGDSRAIL
jgi:hypothetical protein